MILLILLIAGMVKVQKRKQIQSENLQLDLMQIEAELGKTRGIWVSFKFEGLRRILGLPHFFPIEVSSFPKLRSQYAYELS